jgi:hypothetical protein
MVCLGNICINTLHKGAKDDDDDDDDDDDNNNNNNTKMGNEAFTASSISIQVFCDMTPCRLDYPEHEDSQVL